MTAAAGGDMRRLIMGTAGHVDHGKTELVRALTGRDTDRLKEEKERGISIELGFAPLALSPDIFIGIVDVPGHERFVKQMVAGAGGIDLAMLLVAADEGVMPQTREHMEVLRSLDIPGGVVVVSKCDLATDDTAGLLEEEIAELVAGSFLEGAPVVETSARTGAGIDDLRTALVEQARRLREREHAGAFRLAVDRVFHQKGIGVVVTGSCYSGSVAAGDALELLPSGLSVRVRELQSFGEKRERGGAGERLAIALQGARLDDVRRGDMLCAPGVFRAGSTLDARVRLAAWEDFELKNRERVRVHHGAREALGRVILLECDTLRPGTDTLVQVRLESPLVPARGDHIVLRKYSPPRVMGGGTVVDPHPPRHKRFDPTALEHIRLQEAGDPADVTNAALTRAGTEGLAVGDVADELRKTLESRGAASTVGGRMYAKAVLEQLAREIMERVQSHLAERPLQWGMDKEELRRRVGFPHASAAFNRVLDFLAVNQPIEVRENRVRCGPAHAVPDDLRGAIDHLEAAIRDRGVAFASRSEIAPEWREKKGAPLGDALGWLRENGRIVELGDAGVIHGDALAEARDRLVELFEGREAISVGDYKDRLGLSRKHVIPLLEHFDALRVTARSGNERIRGSAFPG